MQGAAGLSFSSLLFSMLGCMCACLSVRTRVQLFSLQGNRWAGEEAQGLRRDTGEVWGPAGARAHVRSTLHVTRRGFGTPARFLTSISELGPRRGLPQRRVNPIS